MNPSKITLAKRIALDLYSLKKHAEALSHELTYLFWECTLRCNLSCLHCGSDCTVDSSAADMPLKDFLKVLDSIRSVSDPSKVVVAITGGEPLMRPDLEHAGEEIRKRGLGWGIVTNGYAMNRKRFRSLLDAGMGSVAISLDGLETDHDWFRGRDGSFAHALDTIKMAADASRLGLHFDVVTCANKRNINSIEILKKVLIDAGVPKWRLVSVFPRGRASHNEELKLDNEQLCKLLDFIQDTRKEGLIDVSYGCEGFLGNYEMNVRTSPFYCRAGIGIGSVLVDGSISACPSLRGDFIQGNIYKDNFMDVWNNRFQIMRNRKWLKTGECKKCNVWKYCTGNGLHLRREGSGELLYCHYKAIRGREGC